MVIVHTLTQSSSEVSTGGSTLWSAGSALGANNLMEAEHLVAGVP